MGGGKMNGRLVGWGSGRFLSSSFSFNRESSSTTSSFKSIFGLRALQGQPQWNFAPFIFYSVVAACLRYVCTWTEEVLFLCANGIELLIKWVSWIHKANQSERERSPYLFIGITTAPSADLANSIVICLLYEFFKCVLFLCFCLFCVMAFRDSFKEQPQQTNWRSGWMRKTNRREANIFLLYFRYWFWEDKSIFLQYPIPEIVPRWRHPSKPFTFSCRFVISLRGSLKFSANKSDW